MIDTVESLRQERDAARADLLNERVARCFDGSQFIRERFTVPPDMMFAGFGKHFAIEDGRAVATDASGQKIMSRERPGEAADFDEALQILVSQTDYADRITRRPRGDGRHNDLQSFKLPDGTTGFTSSQAREKRPNAALPPITRAAFDKLSPWEQSEWGRGGGRIVS